MRILHAKIQDINKNYFEQQRKMLSTKLNQAIINYNEDCTNPEVVFACQEFLRYIENNINCDFKEEIRRTQKVIISFYETDNPSLAYQQCLNIKRKKFF